MKEQTCKRLNEILCSKRYCHKRGTHPMTDWANTKSIGKHVYNRSGSSGTPNSAGGIIVQAYMKRGPYSQTGREYDATFLEDHTYFTSSLETRFKVINPIILYFDSRLYVIPIMFIIHDKTLLLVNYLIVNELILYYVNELFFKCYIIKQRCCL